MPMTEAQMNKPAPLISTKIRTLCFVLEFFLSTSLGVESGEGLGAMGDPVGVDTIIVALAGTVEVRLKESERYWRETVMGKILETLMRMAIGKLMMVMVTTVNQMAPIKVKVEIVMVMEAEYDVVRRREKVMAKMKPSCCLLCLWMDLRHQPPAAASFGMLHLKIWQCS